MRVVAGSKNKTASWLGRVALVGRSRKQSCGDVRMSPFVARYRPYALVWRKNDIYLESLNGGNFCALL